MKITVVPWLLALCLALLQQPLIAAALTGTVYSGGSPVVNVTVLVKNGGQKATTDAKGQYRLDLAPGSYTLIVRGREFPVTVKDPTTRLDIQL